MSAAGGSWRWFPGGSAGFLVLAVWGGLPCGCAVSEAPSGRMKEVFGDCAGIVRSPSRVEVFRIRTRELGSLSLADYTLSSPVALRSETSARLTAILLDERNYVWGVKLGCWPNYGVLARFHSGSAAVDVLFCFECSLLDSLTGDRHLGEGYFRPASRLLLAVVREAFPEDEDLRRLEASIR